MSAAVPIFCFDLGSPYAYLAAERIQALLGDALLWRPVSLGALFKLTGRSSWSLGDPLRRRAGMQEVERRARAYGLPALRWPEPWPSDYLFAMRAATFASEQGVGREFALHAFRDAFQRGRDLGIAQNVLSAAGETGLDPSDVERAAADPQIKLALREASAAAHERGVSGVPTLIVGNALFWGDDRLQEAAEAAEVVRRTGGPVAPSAG